MATDTWLGGTGDWYTLANWSDGIPTQTSDVVISSGMPLLQSGDAGITVASISNSSNADLLIDDPSQTQSVLGDVTLGTLRVQDNSRMTIGGNVSVYELSIDNLEGMSGSAVTIGGDATVNSLAVDGSSNSSLTIGGNLSASSALITSGDKVTVYGSTGLTNTALALTMGGSSTAQATLDVANAAAGFGTKGVLTGNVDLEANSLVEFRRGQINTIGGVLTLTGPNARIADAGSTNSNSALTGLSKVTGKLDLRSGASLRTFGDLSISGVVQLDNYAGANSLAIGGNLSNGGTLAISGSTVAVGGSLSNTSAITLAGTAGASSTQATLNVRSAAGFGTAGVLTGSVYLQGDSLLEFGHGQITAIDGTLWLQDTNARIADAGSTIGNSALTGLSTVSGMFGLSNGASVRTSGNLGIASSGVVNVWLGSSLTIGGNVSNGDALNVSGALTVNGRGGISNNGSIDISGGNLTSRVLTGGTVTIENAGVLEFGAASSASVRFGGGAYGGGVNVLKLDDSKEFSGTLSGLTSADTIDLADLRYVAGKTTASYSGTASGGTLTVRNGFTSVKLALVGDYTSSTWTLSSDGHGGTNLVDPASSPSGNSLVARASSNAVSVLAASQNSQTAHALLTQYAASSFAPAGGVAAVVSPPQVAATPLLASPHHA